MTPAPVASGARERRARPSGPLLLCSILACLTVARASAESILIREAGEVSVTAMRGERNPLDVPAHVTLLDQEAIARSGATSVPELLRREAGVFVTNTTTNPEGFGVEARGFQNGGGNGCRTLVLVDGRRANEPDTGCTDWTFVPLENVERIEIVRGPGSAVYGDNALGGVIEIFTRQPGETTRASLGFGGGSYDTERADLSASTAFGALSAGLFAAYDDTEGFRSRPNTAGTGFTGSSDYSAKRVRLDLGLDLGERGRLGLDGGYASTERGRPGALFTEYATRDGEQAGANFDEGREREHFVQGELALNLPAEILLRAVPYYRHGQSRNVFESQFFAFGSEDRQIVGGLDLQLSRDFEVARRPVQWIGGIEVRGEDYDTTSTFASNEADRRVLGVFTQAEVTLADVWLLSLGVRYDDSDLEGLLSAPLPECPALRCDFDDEEWSPRVALTWRFAASGSLYASYAEGFRFPNLNEAFGSYGFAPTLRPERSKGFELGGKWGAERWRAHAGFYQMRVRDEIFFDPLAPNPLAPPFPGINTNVGEVRHRGVELSGSVALLEWLELYAAYTFDDVEVREDSRVAFAGEQLPITPKHRGNVGVRARLPLGFEASVHASYVGERRLVNDVEPPSDFLPSYATYDARIAWQRELRGGLSLVLEANGRNLTNRHYAEWGGISNPGPFQAIGYWPSPERSFSAGARITFER